VTTLALALVLASAFAHATWNLLAKRAGGSFAFAWLFHLAAAALCAPFAVALLLVERPPVGGPELGLMVGSAVLHLGYFLLLGQGYRFGDLSLVYPLARGTGPLLSTAAAIAFLGERPTGLALAGAVLIALGVVVLTGDPRKLRRAGAGRSVGYALLTGVLIAGYTLWDKHAVSAARIPPLLYFWGFTTASALLLAPAAIRRWEQVRYEWAAHRREALGVGALVPVAYILVLTALATSPVSYVAPAREIGILIGAALGARFLAEGQAWRRLGAAGAMVAGVVALALG
jgi:drug/metabolite transporter (DMT)-like permease